MSNFVCSYNKGPVIITRQDGVVSPAPKPPVKPTGKPTK